MTGARPTISRRGLGLGAATVLASSVGAPLRAQGAPISIPITLAGDRIVIECTLGGQGPYRFVLDTGGVISLIDLQLARRLGLREGAHLKLGMGGGEDTYPIFDAHDVVLGGVARQSSVALAGTGIIAFGAGCVGSFAAGLLTAADSELDFDAAVLRLYPGGGPAHRDWVANPHGMETKGLPGGSAYLYAACRLDGQPLRCALDTGAPRAISVPPVVARRLGLDTRNWSPTGVPGRPPLHLVRTDVFEIGGATLAGQLVAFRTQGDQGGGYYGDGLVGLPMIRQFNLATEVRPNILWMRRNQQPAEAPRYNMTGMWLDKRPGGARVGAVGAGSPAQAAGVQPGDEIAGDFADLLKMTRRPAGAVLDLTVSRDGLSRNVELMPRDYL